MPARMFPAELPRDIRMSPIRRAEVAVYDQLHHQLSSRYTVFYSRPWLGTNPDGTEKEGEADFVVASAETGFLVIEVKGGAVARDGATDKWTSRDRAGRTHQIKNPLAQASRSKHQIIETLRQRLQRGAGWIGAGVAVILPDSTGGEGLTGIDVPREKFALYEEMARIGDWVAARLEETLGERGLGLGAEGMAILEQLLAISFQLRIPLRAELGTWADRVETATQEQFCILEALSSHRELAIAGTAGSGKTILARMEAIRAAEEFPERRILLTCFNTPLGKWLAGSVGRWPNIVAGSFHKVCKDIATSVGVSVEERPGAEYFKTAFHEALTTAVAEHSDLAFDTVVIDEGQDFEDDWVRALRLCLSDEGSRRFRVFFDSNQKLYPRPLGFLEEMPQPPVRLTHNIRNPVPVFDRLVPFLPERSAIARGPEGRPVQEVPVPAGASLAKILARTVESLVETELVRPSGIAVLLPSDEWRQRALTAGRLGGNRVCTADEIDSEMVCVDTVYRFKGLERQVVILVEPSAMAAGSSELPYVALSRTTGHLILLGTPFPVQRDDDR